MLLSSIVDMDALEYGDTALAPFNEVGIALQMAFAKQVELGLSTEGIFIENDIGLDIKCTHPNGNFNKSLDNISVGMTIEYLTSVIKDGDLFLDVVVEFEDRIGLYRINNNLQAEEIVPCACSSISKNANVIIFTLGNFRYAYILGTGITRITHVSTKKFTFDTAEDTTILYNFVYCDETLGFIYVIKSEGKTGVIKCGILGLEECRKSLQLLCSGVDNNAYLRIEQELNEVSKHYSPFKFSLTVRDVFEEA